VVSAAARFSAFLLAFSFAVADMKNMAPAADCAAESHGKKRECNGRSAGQHVDRSACQHVSTSARQHGSTSG
jgi:hypothetical protein